MQKTCSEHVIDKELMLSQVSYYQKEVESFKGKLQSERKEFDYISKDICRMEKLRVENERLRDDVRRLHRLLEATERYNKMPKLV